MKKLLSVFICAVILLGALPAAVSADFVSIDSVKITDLDYPVVGRSFDYNFALPSVYECYYSMDNSKYEKGIVWYDLGTDGSSTASELDVSDVAVKGHIYMAEVYLKSDGSSEMAEFNYTHGRFASTVTVNATCYPELKVIATEGKVDSETKMRAQIKYKASEVFDAAHGVIIDLDSFPIAGDTPLTHVPMSELGADYYTMRAEWFIKGQNYGSVAPLADDYVFKTGESYNLRVILDCGPQAIFTPDTIVTVANLYVDKVDADATRLVADISFDIRETLTIEGILSPNYGDKPQTEGFTSNRDVDVFGNWFYDAGGEFPEQYTDDEFVMGHVYYLQLSISPRTYSLDNIIESDIELNLGRIHTFTKNGDNVVISIEFAIEPPEFRLGDVNGDGKVNARDVTAIMKAIISGAVLPLDRADINNDGKINARDVVALMKLIIAG